MTNAHTDPRSQEGELTEWLLRGFAVAFYVFLVAVFTKAWLADQSRITLLLLLLSEGYTLYLLVSAKRAIQRDLSPLALLSSCWALTYMVALDVDHVSKLIPESIGAVIQVAGTTFSIMAKITLGRSFGVLPAHRKVVLSGPYQWVRHPIYAGYLIAHIGFFGANASWRNLAIVGSLYLAQAWRMHCEEKVLCTDSSYRDYQSQVRWRLVPGVY
ncbi:MAG: isoprenylcysteine carboxylmethyltransferase family protein [Leptothrix sp. (in: b-proteobacteria)]